MTTTEQSDMGGSAASAARGDGRNRNDGAGSASRAGARLGLRSLLGGVASVWRLGQLEKTAMLLAVAGAVIGVALLVYFWPGDDWPWWNVIEPTLAVLTLLFIVLFWFAVRLDKVSKSQAIEIILQDKTGGETLVLPYRPLRSEVSRAELQGILSMYYGPERYDANHLRGAIEAPPGSPSPLDNVLRGRSNTLVIVVPKEFLNHFKAIFENLSEPASPKERAGGMS